MNYQKDLIRDIKIRLKNISGQLNGIIKMLDDDREPQQILIQFKAIKSALENAEHKMLDETFRKSLAANIAQALASCPGDCGQEDRLQLLKSKFPELTDNELARKMKEISEIYNLIEKNKAGK